MSEYRIAPITGREGRAWVSAAHRHLPKIQGALFAVSVEWRGLTVGVALAGKPPPAWEGKPVFVITRVAVIPDLPRVGDHASPACSMLYAALCRAGAALGYSEAWTYTLPGEDGRSIRAAGFQYAGETRGGELSRTNRPRAPVVNPDPKGRWFKKLG